MLDESYRNLCIFHTLDGLRDGLSHFSHPSRAALIYAIEAHDPVRVYDPQNLLHGHEPILKEIYLDSEEWSQNAPDFDKMRRFGQIQVEKNLQLTGLISCGGRSHSVFYQMWFTEHHPDMCSTGPTERWLEHAAWLLSHDLASDNTFCTGTSGYVLREYATHAVYVSGGSAVVRNNTIRYSSSAGVQMTNGATGEISGNQITRNRWLRKLSRSKHKRV